MGAATGMTGAMAAAGGGAVIDPDMTKAPAAASAAAAGGTAATRAAGATAAAAGGAAPATGATGGSYGFVIYVLPMSTGNGADMKAGLDWLIKQNDESSSPLYQKLDTTKVCAAGHSQGSVTVFDFMPDDRVTTTINISGGSFDGMGPSHLKNEAMFLCGPDGNADVAYPQCETDFKNTTVPTFYTLIQGSTHITSGRMGWPASIAWMLWHLAGQEAQWKKEFLEPTGQFQMGMYKSQIKNW